MSGDPTMIQTDCFGGGVNKYVPHSQTSRDAAQQIETDAPTLRESVFRFLASHRGTGATDEEIQRGLGINPSTQRPRRIELVERGLVRDSGLKRRTESGRNAVVWEAA